MSFPACKHKILLINKSGNISLCRYWIHRLTRSVVISYCVMGISLFVPSCIKCVHIGFIIVTIPYKLLPVCTHNKMILIVMPVIIWAFISAGENKGYSVVILKVRHHRYIPCILEYSCVRKVAGRDLVNICICIKKENFRSRTIYIIGFAVVYSL